MTLFVNRVAIYCHYGTILTLARPITRVFFTCALGIARARLCVRAYSESPYEDTARMQSIRVLGRPQRINNENLRHVRRLSNLLLFLRANNGGPGARDLSVDLLAGETGVPVSNLVHNRP